MVEFRVLGMINKVFGVSFGFELCLMIFVIRLFLICFFYSLECMYKIVFFMEIDMYSFYVVF